MFLSGTSNLVTVLGTGELHGEELGKRLANQLLICLKFKQPIVLDFRDVVSLDSGFIRGSFVTLYDFFPGRQVLDKVQIKNASHCMLDLIKATIVLEVYKNPVAREKIRELKALAVAAEVQELVEAMV